jgi:hypothetical protein
MRAFDGPGKTACNGDMETDTHATSPRPIS